jgi:hypothetical protein
MVRQKRCGAAFLLFLLAGGGAMTDFESRSNDECSSELPETLVLKKSLQGTGSPQAGTCERPRWA